MAETFNAYIVHARAKHLIHMLEDIRVSLMERIVVERAFMEKTVDDVWPRIKFKLQKVIDEARNCFPCPQETRFSKFPT